MNRECAVHVVLPAGIGDALRPSGGNTYDRRLCEGLATAGWPMQIREVAGDWPGAGRESRAALAGALVLATGSPDGALARVAALSWRCVCVGPLTPSPDFVAALQKDIRDAGLADRLRLVGPCTGGDLDGAYSTADVLVLASHAETYGMVVTEALARGLPVLACDVGGVCEALGLGASGSPPGMLVPAGDVEALAGAVRRWLGNAGLRRRLRAAAAERRTGLPGWAETADQVARVLRGVAA